jgi:hypothetical protein
MSALLKSTYEAAHELLGRGGLVGEDEAFFDESGGGGQLGVGVVVDGY